MKERNTIRTLERWANKFGENKKKRKKNAKQIKLNNEVFI